ncbi:hypothetical protein [Streptomyces sp. NPDC047841]|uniref:hypothetical protein n=1 Tax=Streptomyces sp. NPDC047841 TaxID=3154708 RepID=UPI0034528A26
MLFIVVAAAVAIALIIGGGIWYARSSGDDGSAQSCRLEVAVRNLSRDTALFGLVAGAVLHAE